MLLGFSTYSIFTLSLFFNFKKSETSLKTPNSPFLTIPSDISKIATTLFLSFLILILSKAYKFNLLASSSFNTTTLIPPVDISKILTLTIFHLCFEPIYSIIYFLVKLVYKFIFHQHLTVYNNIIYITTISTINNITYNIMYRFHII